MKKKKKIKNCRLKSKETGWTNSKKLEFKERTTSKQLKNEQKKKNSKLKLKPVESRRGFRSRPRRSKSRLN